MMREQNSDDAIKINDLIRELSGLKKQLKQKENLIESMSKQFKIGFACLSKTIIIEVDVVFCEILNVTKENLLDSNFNDYFAQSDVFDKRLEMLYSGEIEMITNMEVCFKTTRNSIFNLLAFLDAEMPERVYVHVFRKTNDCNYIDLIKSEQKYRDLINFAVGGILIGSSEGFIIDANNLACELTNRNYDDLIGRHITDGIFCEESVKESPFRFDLLLKGESVVSKRVIKHKSKILPIETHAKLMPDNTYQMILHDITDRVKSEEKLKESEEKFNLAFDENPIPTVLTRVNDGLILNINTACEIESGWSKSEIIGKTSFDIKLWKTDGERDKVVNYLKTHKRVKNFRCSVLRRDGRELTVLLSASLISINNTPCILSSAIDVSSVDMLQKQIVDNEEKYKFLIENLNDLLVQVDSNYKFTYVSDSYCRLFGKTKEDLIGKSFFPLVHPEDVKNTEQEMKNLFTPPYHCYVEQRVDSVNGWRWIAWSDKAIVDQYGKIETIIGLGRDITHQKEIEIELKKAKELAEENSRLKSAFLSNMSHEIRTPMNAIMGFSELLKKPQLSVEKRDEFANIIVSSSKQLINIIDDIIEISRIESGLMKLNKIPFYLNSFFQNLQITLNQLMPKEKDIELKFIPCYGLHDDTVLFSDEVKLKQIMTNLIDNSIKFTLKGSIEMGCLFNSLGKIIFYVKDTGIGIAPENHQAIFERFRQVNNELSWKYSGSGLGLAISKAYVELLGGEIWLESELNKGSVFYFSIPFETKVDFFEKKELSVIHSFNEVLNNRKILIVDDNELNYKYLIDVLHEFNVEVLHAHNGVEAVEIFSNNKMLDLVLMDLKMPKMDGFKASEEILKIDSSAKIIIQSAYSSHEDIAKSTSIGCSIFLSKPINREDLLDAMVGLLQD